MTKQFHAVPLLRWPRRVIAVWAAAMTLVIGSAYAQDAQAPTDPPATTTAPATQTPASPDDTSPAGNRVSCASQPANREHCAANTSAGVSLLKSSGASPCLLGKTWGYDDTGIWVSDGCGGEFLAGPVADQDTEKKSPVYVPNAGFRLFTGDKGEIYFRLFSYARYLNQRSLDGTHVDFFGRTQTLQQRQDIQLNKFFSPFSGWFLTEKFRYYLYVWSANTAQGDPAQVVGAGNLSYKFNDAVTAGFGITSLPSTRSTEGQFPYWLGVDDRLTADEFFRGSYTDGVWLRGDIGTKAKYMAMIGDNLSVLGVSASRLNNKLDTQSYMIQWMPTTGEFGLYGTFGDYDYHEKVATRLGAHYTRSLEDLQSQPGEQEIENTQIRLTDGTIIFTRDLFGPGINVNEVQYQMMSLDGGIKYHGMSLEGEYYRRWLSDFSGDNTNGIPNITDDGYQLQSSAMFIRDILQGYLSGSQIFGDFGNASELRAGVNWYFTKQRGLRFNGEWIHLDDCPVGYTAVPYPVGGNGNLFHFNVEMNF
jgi:hypothetical protein